MADSKEQRGFVLPEARAAMDEIWSDYKHTTRWHGGKQLHRSIDQEYVLCKQFRLYAERKLRERHVHVFRLCEKCSQEYEVLIYGKPMGDENNSIVNTYICPNCGEIDHPWIKVKQEG